MSKPTVAVPSTHVTFSPTSSSASLATDGELRDASVSSHDGSLLSSLSARRRSSKDRQEDAGEELHYLEAERRSPLPVDADMNTTLDWLRKEMVSMRNQDQQLFRQFMTIRSGIQSLKAQQDTSPLSSRSSTPDPGFAGDGERSASPAPVRSKRTVAFRVRSSTVPSTMLQTLTKADSDRSSAGTEKSSPPVLSPIRRSQAFNVADYSSRSGARQRSPSLSGSTGSGNDWDFVSTNAKRDADTFMSELRRNLSGKSKGKLEAGSTAVGRPTFHSSPRKTLQSPSKVAGAAGSAPGGSVASPSHSRSSSNAVAMVLDVNEDSSEC